jgi:hypothetical protein
MQRREEKILERGFVSHCYGATRRSSRREANFQFSQTAVLMRHYEDADVYINGVHAFTGALNGAPKSGFGIRDFRFQKREGAMGAPRLRRFPKRCRRCALPPHSIGSRSSRTALRKKMAFLEFGCDVLSGLGFFLRFTRAILLPGFFQPSIEGLCI